MASTHTRPRACLTHFRAAWTHAQVNAHLKAGKISGEKMKLISKAGYGLFIFVEAVMGYVTPSMFVPLASTLGLPLLLYNVLAALPPITAAHESEPTSAWERRRRCEQHYLLLPLVDPSLKGHLVPNKREQCTV